MKLESTIMLIVYSIITFPGVIMKMFLLNIGALITWNRLLSFKLIWEKKITDRLMNPYNFLIGLLIWVFILFKVIL